MFMFAVMRDFILYFTDYIQAVFVTLCWPFGLYILILFVTNIDLLTISAG